MRRVLFCVVCLWACTHLACVAQSSNDETRMRTVDDCGLFSNDTSVHVLKLQLNWPDKIGDADLMPLQQYLTTFFFGTEATDFVSALNAYTASMGAVVDSMPDMEAAHRYYQDCKLKAIWYSPHQFLSLYAYKQERNGEVGCCQRNAGISHTTWSTAASSHKKTSSTRAVCGEPTTMTTASFSRSW